MAPLILLFRASVTNKLPVTKARMTRFFGWSSQIGIFPLLEEASTLTGNIADSRNIQK